MLVQLKSLFLQKNLIKRIENLEKLTRLVTLDLSENLITKLEDLSRLTNLNCLNVSKNLIRDVDDIQHLRECHSLRVVNLSSNKLKDAEIVSVFVEMRNLGSLYLTGNPAVKKIKHYRKALITSIKRLVYLDDRPVFELERVSAEGS